MGCLTGFEIVLVIIGTIYFVRGYLWFIKNA